MCLCVFMLFKRRGHDVLCTQLPQKQEHVILVRLTALQRALYVEFMNRFREAGNAGWLNLNPLKAFCVCCKVSVCITDVIYIYVYVGEKGPFFKKTF